MVRVVLGMIAFVWLGMLPLQSWAQESQTEENPVCPGRPRYVQPTEEDVKNTGLSLEVLCVITDTALDRHNRPGPGESPDLLRRYLQQGPYENLGSAEYRAVMEEAVRLWPQSQYAHAGLARALLGDNVAPGVQPTPADKRQAADELLLAAEIAFKEGKTPNDLDYGITLPHLLAQLGDKAALDRYFERVFDLVPEGEGRYRSYYDYAQALDKLGDERTETYFHKAIEVSPKGVGDAYYAYTRYLLNYHKAQAVLELLVPNSQADRVMSKPDFHYFRCQALEQVGRETECLQADGPAPPGTPSPP